MMYAKKLKRTCGVRGCMNTDTFALSRTREIGNSVIVCKECLSAAMEAVENEITPNKKVAVATNPPPLFYNAVAIVAPKAESHNEEANDEQVTGQIDVANDTDEVEPESFGFVCEKCGKEFGSAKGLNMHKKSCGK